VKKLNKKSAEAKIFMLEGKIAELEQRIKALEARQPVVINYPPITPIPAPQPPLGGGWGWPPGTVICGTSVKSES